MCVCGFMLIRVAQIITLHTETCNLACTDLLMNPDQKPNKSSSGDEIPERDVTYHLICLLTYH